MSNGSALRVPTHRHTDGTVSITSTADAGGKYAPLRNEITPGEQSIQEVGVAALMQLSVNNVVIFQTVGVLSQFSSNLQK